MGKMVAKTNLNVRKGPSTSHAVVGSIKNGEEFDSLEKKLVGDERWYKIGTDKWVCGSPGKNKWYIEDANKSNSPKPTNTSNQKTEDVKAPDLKNAEQSKKGTGTDKKLKDMMAEVSSKWSNMIDLTTRALGQPPQFLIHTDYRPDRDTINMGRAYIENIFTEAPIVSIIPGRASYLPDASKDQKKLITAQFENKGKDNTAKKAVRLILGDSDTRYYDFASDYEEYIRYVNLMCRVMAIYLGIGEEKPPSSYSTPYKNYSWRNYRYRNIADPRKNNVEQHGTFDPNPVNKVKDAVNALVTELTTPEYVNLYVDANTSFNESASNSTTKSVLESQFVEKFEGLSRELSFFLNSTSLDELDDIKQGAANMIKSMQSSAFVKEGTILDRVLGASSTIIEGSTMTFPEIWSDSEYSKSYNVNMTLQSPYGNKESIYLNVLVPMMHVLALALPRQTSANSFTSPFLVKAFSPGH